MGASVSKWWSRHEKKSHPIEEVPIQNEMDEWYNTRDNIQNKGIIDPATRDNIQNVEEILENMIEHDAQPRFVNSDQLIEEGKIQELIDAILNDVELRGKWQPVNYAAKCGQFYLVNWLVLEHKTDLHVN